MNGFFTVFCRVKIQNVLPADTVAVYKCDFGDINFLNIDALRPLSSEFRQIPQLAIPSKLHGYNHFPITLIHFFFEFFFGDIFTFHTSAGIQPKNNIWNNEDTAFFQKLTVQKQFATEIKAIRKEPGNQSYVLEMVLIDVSTSTDINVNEEMIKNHHANRF